MQNTLHFTLNRKLNILRQVQISFFKNSVSMAIRKALILIFNPVTTLCTSSMVRNSNAINLSHLSPAGKITVVYLVGHYSLFDFLAGPNECEELDAPRILFCLDKS